MFAGVFIFFIALALALALTVIRNLAKEKKQKFPCPVQDCRSVLSSKGALTRHLGDVHGPKIMCNECGNAYTKVSKFVKS